MALIKCKECGSEVSSTAAVCPKCGAPVARTNVVAKTASGIWTAAKLFVGLVMLVVVYQCTRSIDGAKERAPVSTSPVATAANTPIPSVSIVNSPPARTPALDAAFKKEIARVNAMKDEDFCMRELRKLKGKKSPPEPWFEALSIRAHGLGVTTDALSSIQDRSVQIGMNTCAAIAAWGQPERINRTATGSSSTEQWVYGQGHYLYFSGDKIRSVQTSK